MPNWNKILTEVEASNQVNALDRMRKEYFEIIHRETGRNVISYYSGWLKQPTVHTMIDELDKNAFMFYNSFIRQRYGFRHNNTYTRR